MGACSVSSAHTPFVLDGDIFINKKVMEREEFDNFHPFHFVFLHELVHSLGFSDHISDDILMLSNRELKKERFRDLYVEDLLSEEVIDLITCLVKKKGELFSGRKIPEH